MFTGLVEEVGIIQNIFLGFNSAKLTIKASKVLENIKLGDSIATNGVCLTVINFSNQNFEAEAMAETLEKTNLKSLKKGDKVNLERALRLGDPVGGHLVSGHVDGIGKIVEFIKKDIAVITRIKTTESILKYLIPKGSITIDGVSLTIVDVLENGFTVSLIPHTRGITNLSLKKIGDEVNIEVDMISKYVEKFLTKKNKGLSWDLLAENGFI